jgi:hypothetical protein
MSNKGAKPWVVLDFRCDACGGKLDTIIIAKAGTEKRIGKCYHEDCWQTQATPVSGRFKPIGAN